MSDVDKKWQAVTNFINDNTQTNAKRWNYLRDEFINSFVLSKPKDLADILQIQCELLDSQNNQDMDDLLTEINNMDYMISHLNKSWYKLGMLNEEKNKTIKKIEDKGILALMKKLSSMKRGTEDPGQIAFITSLEVMLLGMMFGGDKKEKYKAIIKGLLGKK